MRLRFNFSCPSSVVEVADLGRKLLRFVSLRFNVDDMTCDITLKKVFYRLVAPCARHGRLLFLSLYIYIIYIYNNMSLRQKALLEGLSCVTLKKQPLSSVTAFPILGTADRSSLPSVPSHHFVTL